MLVRELMTTDVVTVRSGATLRDAIEQLLSEGVGSVIVVDENGNPGGLVTETDALRAIYRAGTPPSEIAVRELSDGGVVTTGPDATVQKVARTMARERVKKVPVMDDLDLVGIVTLTDIVWHLSEIRQEAQALDDRRQEWHPDG